MTFMLGTYAEDVNGSMNGKVKIVEDSIGFRLDAVRSADWSADWGDVEGTYNINQIRSALAPRQAQHMSVMFPKQFGKTGSKDGWRRMAKGEFKANTTRSFINKLRALPAGQTILFLSTTYETNCNFWFNDIIACGGEQAYIDSIVIARECADEAERQVPGKKIILVHNPVNETRYTGQCADFAKTFVAGKHGAIFINCYDKPEFQGGNPQAVLNYWLNSHCGLKSIVALAKKHNVFWGMAEMGFGSNGRDIKVLTDGVLKFTTENFHAGKGCALFSPWPSDKDYPGNVYAGRSPKAATDLSNLMKGLAKLKGSVAPGGGTEPKPEPEQPKPEVTKDHDDLAVINKSSFERKGSIQVAGDRAAIESVEGIAWAPLAAVQAHGKAGDTAGKETDPKKAKALIVEVLNKAKVTDARAVSLVAEWRDMLPKMEDPVTQPPAEDTNAKDKLILSLQARIKTLESNAEEALKVLSRK